MNSDNKLDNSNTHPPGFSHVPRSSNIPEQYSLAGYVASKSQNYASNSNKDQLDLHSLSSGIDLSSQNIPQNVADAIYPHIVNTLTDQGPLRTPLYSIPNTYYFRNQVLDTTKVQSYSEEVLFYAVYYMPNDIMQIVCAKELYKRGWMYSKSEDIGFQLWVRPAPENVMQNPQIPLDSRQNLYLAFNYIDWKIICTKINNIQVASVEEVCGK